MTQFTEWFRSQRISAGYDSQALLASAIRLTEKTVREAENGRILNRNRAVRRMIAEKIGVSVEELESRAIENGDKRRKDESTSIRLKAAIREHADKRAAELNSELAEFVNAALQAVLAVEDWKPGMALTIAKDTAPPHTEAPSTRVLHGGGAGRKAAKK